MHPVVIQRIVGLLLVIFSFAMLPPALVGLWYGDGAVVPFMTAFFIMSVGGLALWFPVRKVQRELRVRD